MGMSVGDSGGMSAEPNVVPMIDILLVLLIIFMVSQPMSRMALNIQEAPPETRTANESAANNQIVLELPDNGGYLINQQPVPEGQLDAQLHTIYDPRPAKLLFIKAGRNRVYQDVIDAMDVARGAGVQIIGFTPVEAYR